MPRASAGPPPSSKRPRTATPPASASGFGAYARSLAGETGEGDSTPLEPLSPPLAAAMPSDGKRLWPRAPRTEPLPEELERKFLPAFVARAAASLPPRVWRAIGDHVGKSASGPVVLTLGTACSGSEFYLTALPFLEKEMLRRLGREVRFDHKWSCELAPAKRQWIMDNFQPKKLFGDITVLADGRCHDYASGDLAEVDPVDILIAGTSCKDASRLNPHHAKRLNVVDAGLHTTGGTFQGFARLVAKFGPRCRILFLENVASLRDRDPQTGRSNFDGVADVVRALGFAFVSAVFSAVDTGLPVARPRLYMSGVRHQDEAEAQRRVDEVMAFILASARPLPLDSLLLQRGDPWTMMRDWMREGLARDTAVQVLQGEEAWFRQHPRAWQEIPPSIAQSVAAQFADNPWMQTLPPRSRDLLLLASCRHHLARLRPVVVPVHLSLGFALHASSSSTHVPTLVPNGVFWLSERERPLLGVEAIRLQGCDPSLLPGLRPESHDSSFLLDLAGNAFCVYQFCTWLIAVLAAGDLARET